MKIFKITLSLIICPIICLGACGRKSDPEAPEVYAPRAVTAVDIKCEASSIEISWGAPLPAKNVETSAAQNFSLRRRVVVNNIDSSIEKLGTISADVLPDNKNNPTSKYQFEDKDVTKGNAYKYYISAVDAEGMEGAIDVIYKVNFLDGSCIVEPLNSAREGSRS